MDHPGACHSNRGLLKACRLVPGGWFFQKAKNYRIPQFFVLHLWLTTKPGARLIQADPNRKQVLQTI